MKKLVTLFFAACSLSAAAQTPFPPLDTNYAATEVRVSRTLKTDVLFEANRDYVWNGTEYAIARTWHDFTGLVPLGTGNDSCLLIVNHELRSGAKNPKLGDGGGMTVFRANKNSNGRWAVAPYKGHRFWNVNFSGVRGTLANCGGVTLPNGKFMTAEEWTFARNSDALLLSNFSDTSDFTIPSGPFAGRTLKFFQNFGFMVTVDAQNARALHKNYAMGRASFEGGWAMPDRKTVYLGVDETPAPILKFVADTADNYEYGQLYAYKQGANGVGGSWLPIPRDWDSVYTAPAVAIRKGATMFTRIEWIVEKDGKVYFSETGNDAANYQNGMRMGGVPSFHFSQQDTLGGAVRDSIFQDYYGRVLVLDTTTNTIKPLLEGGRTTKSWSFSNPDGLAVTEFNGKKYLIVIEDLNGTSQGRSGANGVICEAFYLDLSIPNPTRENLVPFVACPLNAELTGAVSTPDGKTMFINSQHPGVNNVPPFNNDVTVALTGFSFTSSNNEIQVSESFKVYPNPTSDVINFNKTTDVAIYNLQGQQIRIERNVHQINVSDLATGVYFLQTISGEVVKVIKN